MDLANRKNLALAVVAAGALAGHASAFAPLHGGALAQLGRPLNSHSVCTFPQRQHVARGIVRMSSGESSVAEKIEEDRFGIQVDKGSIAIDPSGNAQIEAKGEYLEDGWVDPSASSGSGLGGFFGGLFGGARTSTSKQDVLRTETMRAELDVIEYLDGTKGSLKEAVKGGTAVPFGGLNPKQIEAYNKAKEAQEIKMAAMPEGVFIQYPKAQKGQALDLPDGWYSALDEASGSEYYYNDEGETTWDPPTKRK